MIDPLAFLAEHGVVLASARGPVPSVAEAIAGEPIRGSWWGHPRGQDIFRELNVVADSPDALSFKLVAGKVTFVHRRLWPALVRLADRLGQQRLAVVRQEHTASGAHRTITTPFPDWVTEDVASAAAGMSEDEAAAALGPWVAERRARRRR